MTTEEQRAKWRAAKQSLNLAASGFYRTEAYRERRRQQQRQQYAKTKAANPQKLRTKSLLKHRRRSAAGYYSSVRYKKSAHKTRSNDKRTILRSLQYLGMEVASVKEVPGALIKAHHSLLNVKRSIKQVIRGS